MSQRPGGGAVLNTKVLSTVTIPSATESVAGLMSAEDKAKLDDMGENIEYNVSDGVLTISLA